MVTIGLVLAVRSTTASSNVIVRIAGRTLTRESIGDDKGVESYGWVNIYDSNSNYSCACKPERWTWKDRTGPEI